MNRRDAFSIEHRGERRFDFASEPVEVLRPIAQSADAEPLDGPAVAVPFDHLPRGQRVVFRTRTDECERRWSERELEQPAAQRRDIVVVPLGRGLSDYV